MTMLKKVLVVDDDPVVGRSFHRVLANKGYAVVTAADGAEALAKIAAENYDVVYADIRMPGMDGIEVAEHIKGRQPWLPVVIVSGYATAENEARAKAAGVRAVLHKPLSPQMIEDSAIEALREERGGEPATSAVSAPAVARAEPIAPVAPLARAPRRAKLPLRTLKTLSLLAGAPLAGLVYVIFFPVYVLALIIGMPLAPLGRAIAKRASRAGPFAKNVGLFLAAPFIGLAYTIALPFVALGMLAWIGVKALLARASRA